MDVVVVVVVVDIDDEGDGAPVLGVVGSENISSSCNNKDDIFLSNYKSTREEKNDSLDLWFELLTDGRELHDRLGATRS